MDNFEQIPLDEEIHLLTKATPDAQELTLYTVPSKIYTSSDYCCKMFFVLPSRSADFYNVPQEEKVLVLRDYSADELITHHIENLPHLVNFLQSVQRLGIAIDSLQSDILVDGFIINWQRQCIEDWKNNVKLLYNTETSEYNKTHFIEKETEEKPKKGKKVEDESDSSSEKETNDDADPDAPENKEEDNIEKSDATVEALNKVVKHLKKATTQKTPGPAGATGGGNYGMPLIPKHLKAFNRPYRISPIGKEHMTFTKEEIDAFFEIALVLEPLSLLKNFTRTLLLDLCSCHLALQSKWIGQVLERVHGLEDSLFYAFRVLYLEEKAKYITTTHEDRFLFTLSNEEQFVLPNFPFHIDHPYLPFLIGNKRVLAGQPIEPCALVGKRGIHSHTEFLERVNTYTEGILKGLDWSKTALCGSTITACLIENPLETACGTFKGYIEEYYPGQKLVDPARNLNPRRPASVAVPKSRIFYSLTSGEKNEDDSDASHTDDENTMPTTTQESDDSGSDSGSDSDSETRRAIRQSLKKSSRAPTKGGDYVDIDIMIETTDMEEFDKIVSQHYEVIRQNVPELYRSNVALVQIETENKYKYRITGLPREVEFFCVNSIPGVIAKFHLGCVRAWYDGTKVYMFPTFVSTAYTGLHFDMRWTSCNKDLRDIVLKYYQRGFGFMVNAREKIMMRNHLTASPKWPAIAAPPPAHHHGRWRFRRMHISALMFQDVAKRLLNPSVSRMGIGYGVEQKMRTLAIDFNPSIKEEWRGGKWRKLRTSKRRTLRGVEPPALQI
jgi:hypothetical protein